MKQFFRLLASFFSPFPKKLRSGFTLFEVMIVIGIIGIISSIALSGLSPLKNILAARDAGRIVNAKALENAFFQHLFDHMDVLGGNKIAEGRSNAKPICRSGITLDTHCVNIDALVPSYIAEIPVDSAESCLHYTGFSVYDESGRIHVVANHLGLLESEPVDACVTSASNGRDSDSDGIRDAVDTEPEIVSNDFNDGTIAGTISNRGDQNISIIDAPDAADGIYISADASGGSAPAVINVGAASLSFSSGDSMSVTFGDIILRTLYGIVDITFTVPGTNGSATSSLPEGNALTFISVNSSLTPAPENTQPISVNFAGQVFSMNSGTTISLLLSAIASSSIAGTTATITWASYESSDSQVEYGTTTAYGSSTNLDVSMVTSHSQGLTGLSSQTLYHYRVKSRDAAGNLAVSTDFTFTTLDITAPVLSTVASSSIAGTTATITWTSNESSDSQVEYGTTTAYGTTTVLDASLVASHSQNITGLSSQTLYHYRVKSRDVAGNLAVSTDFTFTTLDTTAPVLSAIASPSIAGTTATVAWTTNESSDSQVEYGTTTAYGSSTNLDASMVTSHSQGLTGLSSQTLYHYRVKSRDAAGNLAVSTDVTFTTLDITAPVISTVASSSIADTTATITWTTNESANTQVEYGTTTAYGTTTTLNASLVTSHSQGLTGLTPGVLYHYRIRSIDAAGNIGLSSDGMFTTPDTTPPVISVIASSSIAGTTATITWTTNESTNTQVEYGTTTAYGISTTLNASLVTSHSQGLTSLTSQTLYHYRVKSRDAAGNISVSSDSTFTTLDITAPVVSAITSTIVTPIVTIAWTTNESSDTQVEYGTTTAYGNSTTLNSTMVLSHSQALTGLTSLTLYHYRVKSRDAAGNLATSTDRTFTTTDFTPPVISSIASSSITGYAATISWTTNESANTQVEYGTTTAYGTTTTLNASLVTSHSQGLSSLSPQTLYHYRVKSSDAAGNLTVSSDGTFTTLDVYPPTISATATSEVSETSTTITWTTDEPADTQVEYGAANTNGTYSYTTLTTLNTAMVTSHSATLTGLTPGALYHYRVKSRDPSGNLVVSDSDPIFVAATTFPPVITNIVVSGITQSSCTITWTTNKPADTQVEYDLTTAYYYHTFPDSWMVTSHSKKLTGLSPRTLYHFRVKSLDAYYNIGLSNDITFTTL